MELSTLSFKVSTTELDTAATKIKSLGTEVGNLSKAMSGLTKETASSAKAQAQANLANAKAETELAKAIAITTKSEEQATKVVERKVKASEKVTKATKDADAAYLGLADSLTRTRDLMSESWSRGESNQIKLAEAAGLVGTNLDYVKSILKDIGGLSASPFDSSLGSIRSMNKEFDGLVLRSKLVAQGIELNNKQLTLYARLAAEAAVEVKKMGMDPTQGEGLVQYNKILEDTQQQFLRVAVANKNMIDGEKGLVKQHRETASAKSFLIKEDERMLSVQEQINGGTLRSVTIAEKAATATANYARNLRLAGVSGQEATTRLAAYSKMQQDVSAKEEQRVASNLARGLQPQITDFAVSLWSGQSPLTVLLQQGGQTVDMFKLSGLEASKLGATMKTAFTGMLPSIMAVGGAVGGLFADGLKAIGSGLVKTVSDITLFTKAADITRDAISGLSKDVDSAAKNIEVFDNVVKNLGKGFTILATGSVIALAAIAVTAYQGISVMTELSKAVYSVGASYGLTRDQLAEYAKSMSGAGVTTYAAADALTLMVRAGAGSTASIQGIARAAIELEKYGGQAVKDTAEQYKKLKEDPLKALSALRVETGLVTEAQMENISSLLETGERLKAVALAEGILEKAHTSMANSMKNDMNPLQMLWHDMTNTVKDLYQALINLTTSGPVVVSLTSIWNGLKLTVQSVATTIKGVALYMAAISKGDFAEAGRVLKDAWSTLGADAQRAVDNVSKARQGTVAGINEVAKASQEQSKSEAARILNKKIGDELDQKLLSQSKKQVTQQEYINKQIEEYKKNAEGSTISTDNLAKATKAFGEEWKRSQPKSKGLSEEQKQLNKAQEEYIDIQNKANGVNKEFNNQVDRQNLLFTKGRTTKEEYVKVLLDLIKTQKFSTDAEAAKEKALKAANKAAEEQVKLQQDFNKIQQEFTATTLKNQEGINQENASLSLRAELLGKTEEEQKKINDSYKVQGELIKINAKYDKQRLDLQEKWLKHQSNGGDMLVGMSEWNSEIKKSVEQQGEEAKGVWAGVAMSAAESYVKEMQRIKDIIADVVMVSLFEGGKIGGKKLRDAIVLELRKPIKFVVDAVINTITGSIMGGPTGSAMGAASGGLMKSVAGSAVGQSLGLGTVGTAFSGAFSSGAALGTEAFGAGVTMMSEASGLSSFMAGAGQALGAIGPIGWAALAAGAILAMNSGGETRSGGAYKLGTGGAAELLQGPSGGQIMASQSAKMLEVTTKAINDTFKAIGSSTSVSSFLAGLESSDNGKGFAYATGTLSTGATFGDVNTYNANRGDKTPEQAFKEYNTQLNQSFIEALQVAPDVPVALTKIITDSLNGQEVKSLTDEATTALLKTLNDLVTTVVGFNEVMLSLPFESLKNMSFDAAAGLIQASGGLEKLGTNLKGFYDNFFDDTEKLNYLTTSTTKAFSDLGIEMPAVNASLKEWYKQQVLSAMALDQSIPANAKATAGLLNLQGGVIGLAESVKEVEVIVKESTTSLADDLTALADKLKVFADNVTAFQKQINDDYLASVKATDDAYNSLIKSQESEIKLLEDRTSITDSALSALGESIDAEKQRINLLIEGESVSTEAAKAQVSAIKSIFDLLTSSIKELRSEVTSTAEMQLSAAKDLIQLAISSGNLPSQEILSGAIGSVRTGLSNSKFNTKTDRDRAFLSFANELEKLTDSAKPQLTAAEQLLLNSENNTEIYKNQLTALDAQLKQSRDQVSLLRGLTAGTKSVENALSSLSEALLAEQNSAVLIQSIKDQVKLATDSYNELRGLNTGVLNLTDSIKVLIAAILSETTLGSTNAVVNPVKPSVTQPFTPEERSSIIATASTWATAKGTTPEAELYDYAKSQGYTDEMIDVKMGFAAGSTKAWANANKPATQQATVPSRSDVIRNYIASLASNTELTDIEKARTLATQANLNGVSESELASVWGASASATRDYFNAAGIPQFASGINNVPFDMTARIHEGEAIVPKKFNPFNPNATSGVVSGNSDVVQELQALRVEVSMLRAETRPIAINTSRIAKAQDRTIEADVVKVKIVV